MAETAALAVAGDWRGVLARGGFAAASAPRLVEVDRQLAGNP